MIQLAAALGVLLVPGLAVGLAAGLRGWTLAATATILSYAVIAVTGALCTITGWRYSLPTVLGGTAVAVALFATARTARWLWRRRARPTGPIESAEPAPPPQWPGWRGLAVIVATLVGCGIGFWVIFQASGQFTGVPQDWDALFHGNAIRYIAETGRAGPAALAGINRYDQPTGFYYPNTYHLMAAAAHTLAGGSVLLMHTVTMALIPPMLTVGLVGLVHSFSGRAALAAAVAVLSAATSALPYDLILRGPLTPYATGVVLVPAFLVLVHRTLRPTLGRGPAPGRRSLAAAVLTGASGSALLGIHPSVAIIAALFALAMVTQHWLTAPRQLPGDCALLTLAGALTLVTSISAILGSLNSVAEVPVFDWPADLPAAQAIGDLIGFSHASPFPRWFLLIPLVAGVIAVQRLRPLWWMLAGSAIFGGLFLLSSAYPQPFVAVLNRPWWNDRWRLVAVATLGTILLAAHGTVVLTDLARQRASSLAASLPRGVGTGVGRVVGRTPVLPALVAVVLAVGSNGFYAPLDATRVRPQFVDGPTVSDHKREGIRVLATLVPPDSRVLNQNNDGSGIMYAIAGIKPVNGYIEISWRSPAQALLEHRFNQIDTDPQVQAAVARLNIQYVFLTNHYIRPNFIRPEGFRNLDRVSSLELVYQNPEVQIYRIRQPSPLDS